MKYDYLGVDGIILKGRFVYDKFQLESFTKTQDKLNKAICFDRDFLLNGTEISKITQNNSVAISMSYCETIEKNLEIDVPLKAKYIRVFLLEYERIVNHLKCIKKAMLHAHVNTNFVDDLLLDFEKLINIYTDFSKVNEKNLGDIIVVGGVIENLPIGYLVEIDSFLKVASGKIKNIEKYFCRNTLWHKRSSNVGCIDKSSIFRFGISGPVARSANVKFDTRTSNEIYRKLNNQDTCVVAKSDVFSRTLLRVNEIINSINTIAKIVSVIPNTKVISDNVNVCLDKTKSEILLFENIVNPANLLPKFTTSVVEGADGEYIGLMYNKKIYVSTPHSNLFNLFISNLKEQISDVEDIKLFYDSLNISQIEVRGD